MPGFDGTGPRGQGPMTGGGRGYCAVSLNGPATGPFYARGYSGRGGGRGYRNRFYATGVPGWAWRANQGVYAGYGRALTKEEELSTLKSQADLLRSELEQIQSRVSELETR